MKGRRAAVCMSLAAWTCLFGLVCPVVRAEEAPGLTIAEIIARADHFKGDDEASRTARAELVQAVQNGYLLDVSKTKRVSLEDWRKVLWALRQDLSGATRAVWIPKFRAAFVPADGVVPHRSVMGLSRVLHVLGDRDHEETARALFERIHESGGADRQTCHEICLFWVDRRRKADAGTWARRAYDAVLATAEGRQAASLGSVRGVGELYCRTRLSGKGKGYPEFAQAVLSLAERGVFDAGKYDHCLESAVWVGLMLGTAETRQTVQLGIAGENGHLRVGLHEILAWAHQRGGTMRDWKAFLDGKAADGEIAADARAYWLLARAYAEPVSKDETNPAIGRPWLTRALATAESPEARLYVVERIAMGYAFINRKQRGLTFLASVAGQFETHADKFAAMKAAFIKVCAMNQAYADEKMALQEARKARNYRRAVCAKLTTARRRGDRATVEQLERTLEQLDQ
ncbi:MAG: hypothetical protein ABIF82_12690 [Planctomycetota bacterium]